MIAIVWMFTSGQFMVFDHNGEQMPEYQAGEFQELRRKILADAPKDVEFHVAQWREWEHRVPIEQLRFNSWGK